MSATTLRIALAQINPLVGDLDGNAALIEQWAHAAEDAGADLVVFPEQALIGYPAEDLLLKRHVLDHCTELIEQLAGRVPIPTLVGAPERAEDTFNSCAVLADGEVAGWYRKQHLPNYGVFDEHRWFRRGSDPLIVECAGVPVGVTICEDIWVPGGPAVDEAAAGAHVIVNLSASPWRLARGDDREQLLAARATETGSIIALVNQVGGQDELAFDGRSLIVDHHGEIIARGAHCAEALVVCDLDVGAAASDRLRDPLMRSIADGVEVRDVERIVCATPTREEKVTAIGVPATAVNAISDVPTSPEEECWAVLCMALADYVRKNGFGRVVLGMSGGIDSALVLAIAVDALGAERVRAVTMPSVVTSSETRDDAIAMTTQLGVELHELPIEPVMTAFETLLAPLFVGRDADITEENLQARIRGNLLMAISNKFGDLVLTTGNKSEVSVGYSTLYGDAAGGFAPIKDVPKTLVWELARWRNERAAAEGQPPFIPPSIIERPPTAELRSGQLDSDSLPPYDVLDAILEGLVERDESTASLVADGYDAATVERVSMLLDRAEYKRRQAPPGIRVTSRSFGRERRMPITNGWREPSLVE